MYLALLGAGFDNCVFMWASFPVLTLCPLSVKSMQPYADPHLTLRVSPQQSAQIAPFLANEGRKVIGIRNNNSLSNVQKTQEVASLQKQSDPQLKAIFSSAQCDKLKVVRYQVVRWVTQKRLGWQ